MRLLICALILFTTGCASIFFNDYKQVVKVISDPPGVEIFDHEGHRLGVTPAFIKIRRSQKSELKLQSKNGEIKSVTLEGHYRWSPSFYGNLIYMTYAPAGMGIDYLTKTAFHFDNPEVIKFNVNTKRKEKLGPDVQVIAPPQSEWSLLSNQVGVVLQSVLRQRSSKKYIKNYEETLPVFIDHHYRFDYRESGENLDKIFYDLDADEYVESKVNVLEDTIKVDVTVRSAFSQGVIDSFSFERPQSEFKIFHKSKLMRKMAKYFSFAPNAVGIDFATYNSSFQLAPESIGPGAREDVKGIRVASKGFDEWLNIVSALNVLYVRPPNRNSWQYNLLFVPSLYASAVTFKYEGIEDIEDVEFRRFRVGMGYGPQVTASSRYGTIYFGLIPTFNYTKISWGAHSSSQQVKLGEFLLLAELGYQLFLSNSMAIRFFAKGWSENASRWSNVISNARSKRTEVESSSVGLGGVSLIWYWPSLQKHSLSMMGY